MEVALNLVLLGLCVAASALYSGSEIGIYSLSRVRVELEADQGNRSAGVVRRLLGDETALLITILIGNNLALELASHLGDDLVGNAGLEGGLAALVVTLVLGPVLFLGGEALPKELFRRRPHGLTYPAARFVWVSRGVFWPLERLLWGLSAVLERLLGVGRGRGAAARGRERLVALLAEGRRLGALHERAEVLARNALTLRSTPISRAMVPWERVLRLEREVPADELFELVRRSHWTRLPVVDGRGHLAGYVHQLEVLGAGPASPVLDHLRSMLILPADTPVDRALLTLRGGGQRAAVVGSEREPLGLVTLKDLVEEISGDLVGL